MLFQKFLDYFRIFSDRKLLAFMGSGMMGNSFGYGFGYWSFLNVLYVTLLIGLIILVYIGIIKLWKDIKNKGAKKWKK